MKKGFTLAESATHVTSLQTVTKFGFTLAEVLITLGIIGIVAAITIPNLISAWQKKATVAKIQKAISIWNNAYKLSVDELGEPTENELRTMSATQIWNKYYAPYIKGTVCTTYSKCGYTTFTPFKHRNGTRTGFAYHSKCNVSVYTNDGYLYILQTIGGSGELEHKGLLLDINGSAPPNIYGKDVFAFNPNENNGFFPVCTNKSNTDVNNDCSMSGRGICCAEKIRRAGWKIDNSYPWK